MLSHICTQSIKHKHTQGKEETVKSTAPQNIYNGLAENLVGEVHYDVGQ